MPDRPQEVIPHEKHLALAKLVEVFEVDRYNYGALRWLCGKHALQFPLREYDSGQGTRPSDWIPVLRQAYGSPAFPHLFSDLIEAEVQRLLSKAPASESRKRAWVREQIIQGKFGWGIGKRALQILGFEMALGRTLFDQEAIVLLPFEGGTERKQELDRLRLVLLEKHHAAALSLQGAYEAYTRGGVDAMRQACDSCRNALENVVHDTTGEGLGPGLHALARDSESRKEMFLHLRNFLSGRGTHAPEQPSEEDALLAIRISENVITWILKRSNEW